MNNDEKNSFFKKLDKKLIFKNSNSYEVDEIKQSKKGSSLKLLIFILIISLICIFSFSYYQNNKKDILETEKKNYLFSKNFMNELENAINYKISTIKIWDILDEQNTEYEETILYYISPKNNNFFNNDYKEDNIKNLKDNLVYARYEITNKNLKQLEFKSNEEFKLYEEKLYSFIYNSLQSDNRLNVNEILESKYNLYYNEGKYVFSDKYFFDEEGNFEIKNGNLISLDENNAIKKDMSKLKKVIRLLSHKDNLKKRFSVIIPKDILNTQISKQDYNFLEYISIKKIIEFSFIWFIGFIVTILFALFTPSKKQIQIPMVKVYNEIFLITKICITVLIYTLVCFLLISSEYIKPINIDDSFKNFDESSRIFLNFFTGNGSFYYSFGISVSFITFLLTYLVTANIKYIHNVGFIDGFIRKTVTGNLIIKVFSLSKTVLLNIKKKIELKEKKLYDEFFKKYKKILILMIIANASFFIMVSAIFIKEEFLIFMVIITYTVYFVFLYKYIRDFLKNLEMVQETTQNISNGNFNSHIDENLGILSKISSNLNSIGEAFKTALEEEVKSQNMKTQLISNVSHDLKTPLTSIINYSDLLKNKALTQDEKQEYIDIIYKKSQRLKILIEDLFEVSKVSSGNIKLNLEKLDIVSLLRQTLGEMEEKIRLNHLDIRINLPDEKVFCNIDGVRTYRIFSNIISNITKYTLKNTRVYIDLEDEDNNIAIYFKNISNYEMNFDEEEIMQRFQRGDKSRNQDGHGLGLAIAKSLMELQNGSININVEADLFKLCVRFAKVR